MPSGLLAAGGHDVNWRSLRYPYQTIVPQPTEHTLLRLSALCDGTDPRALDRLCRSSELYNPTQDTWTSASLLPDSISFAAYASAQVFFLHLVHHRLLAGTLLYQLGFQPMSSQQFMTWTQLA